MINEELCNLIWKRYNEHPSAHLYALWIAYKECSDSGKHIMKLKKDIHITTIRY